MKPPFRADQVGSLLRPKELAEARKAFKRGAISAARLAELENIHIKDAIQKQESIGLQAISDGEFRRDWWHLDFMAQLDGVSSVANPGPKFGGTEEQPPIPSVTGKLGCSKPIMVQDFVFLKQNTSATAKFTIPSPAMLHLRGGMTVTMHTCRGNFKSSWVASGGYEPVAEAMFSSAVDAFFMEFDSERAGGFSSTHHGNALTMDEQWRKLERVVEVAREVWG